MDAMANASAALNRRIIYLRSVWRHYAQEYGHGWKPDTLLLQKYLEPDQSRPQLHEILKTNSHDACLFGNRPPAAEGR
jgi:hypothetical protein